MQPYIELNAHHIGKSHVLNGLSCEDYSLTYSDDQVSVVTVSDGHGDKNCFRSAAGAKCACETAIRYCRQFVKVTSHIEDVTQCDFESLVLSLESQISDMWKATVLIDAVERPFTDEELAGASRQAQDAYRSGQRMEKAYGCTLIVALATDRFWLAFQIGDGKCAAAYPDGVFVEPIAPDENCVGNHSTSLCNSNAKESFRHYYSNLRPLAVFVSSDGVEESFDQAGLFQCFYSVAYWAREEGPEAARQRLEELLPQISEGGSGDDVSLAAMVSTSEPISKPRQSLDQVYARVSSCADALEHYHTRLVDAEEKRKENEKRAAELETEIAKLREAMAEKQQAYEQVLDEGGALKNTVDDLNATVQRASEQMEKVNKYRETAERFWFEKLDRIGLAHPERREDAPPADAEQAEPVPEPPEPAPEPTPPQHIEPAPPLQHTEPAPTPQRIVPESGSAEAAPAAPKPEPKSAFTPAPAEAVPAAREPAPAPAKTAAPEKTAFPQSAPAPNGPQAPLPEHDEAAYSKPAKNASLPSWLQFLNDF